MKIVAVMESEPPSLKAQGGDTGTVFWLLEEFRRRGHELSIVYYFDRTVISRSDDDLAAKEQALRESGYQEVVRVPSFEEVEPHWLDIAARKASGFARVIRHLRLRERDRRKIEYIQNAITDAASKIPGDVIFCFGNATLKLKGRVNKPVAAWLTNTDKPLNTLQIEMGYRSFYGSMALAKLFRPITDWQIRRNRRKAAMNFDKLMVPTQFYADDWRAILGKHVEIETLYCPADDELGDVLRPDPYEPPRNKPVRVVLLGHLRSTLTTANLMFFVREIIPALKRRNLMDQFSFEIVGKYPDQPHPLVAHGLEEPNIKRLGFVENVAEAVNGADILLHATPNPPGAGGRLSTCCAVAAAMVLHRCVEYSHRPEYVEGVNCLFAETGDEFVDAMLSVANDPELSRRLRTNARKTFENMFTLETCMNRVEPLVYAAAEAGKARTA